METECSFTVNNLKEALCVLVEGIADALTIKLPRSLYLENLDKLEESVGMSGCRDEVLQIFLQEKSTNPAGGRTRVGRCINPKNNNAPQRRYALV